MQSPRIETYFDGLAKGFHQFFVVSEDLSVGLWHVDFVKNEVIDYVLTYRYDLLAVTILGSSKHSQELQDQLSLSLSRCLLVQVVFQKSPYKMQVKCASNLEHAN